MNIVTASPEIADVPGAASATVTITDVPCGTCYTTAFHDAAGTLVRQDQHVDAFRAWDGMQGAAAPPVGGRQ